MTGVLMILALRRDPDRKGETGEELLISEEEGGEETGEAVGQEKIWTSPGSDAKIRVLLLDQSGSIYHKEKDAGEGYSGELDYYEEPQGWVIVNEVPLEEYLRFVVPSEMPASYALEALKAQAVCARTYAVWQMQEYAYPEYEAHVREPFHSVFYALFERFGDRIDGNAELDDDVNVDVDPVAVRRYAYALPFGAAAEQLGKAVRKTARYGFDDAVALRGGMRSHPARWRGRIWLSCRMHCSCLQTWHFTPASLF